MKSILSQLKLRLPAAVTAMLVFGLAVHFASYKLQLAAMAGVGLGVFLLYGPLVGHGWGRLFYALCGLVAAVLVVFWIGLPGMTRLAAPRIYDNFENLETQFFSGKRVLILVPHEDDELNLAGGLMEQYTAAGSEVYLVYGTNGDFYGGAETRCREALAVASACGIPGEQVYFLGFGDGWTPVKTDGGDILHIYNSPRSDLVWTSHFGETATYGTQVKDCYLQRPYTREAYLESILEILRELRPDTIFCNDKDSHMDHRAVSYLFEEALGQLLQEDEGYHPTVYKGFCYVTAWNAWNDFTDSLNPLSTHWFTPREDNPYYHWEDRIRMPLDNRGLHRLLSETTSYKNYILHDSQAGMRAAGSATNGDKLFWARNTNSVLYSARITVGGRETELLNDFKLLDSSDMDVSIPDLGVVDVSGGVEVTLREKQTLAQVGLYDDPDSDNNILSGYLLLRDGTTVDFGPLEPTGVLTYIDLPGTEVTAFSVHVTDYEGEAPGLTEVEAYTAVQQPEGPSYLMFVDEGDSFVYDYVFSEGDTVTLSLYSYPETILLEDVTLRLTGDEGCSYTLLEDKIEICVPGGGSCILEAAYGETVTRAKLSHISPLAARSMELLQAVDSEIYGSENHPLSWAGQMRYWGNMLDRLAEKVA